MDRGMREWLERYLKIGHGERVDLGHRPFLRWCNQLCQSERCCSEQVPQEEEQLEEEA